MNWYVSSIFSAALFTGQFLFMQKLQKSFDIRVYMAHIWIGSGILLSLIFLKFEHIPLIIQNLPILLLGGIASWAGMYSYNLAIRAQANLGYIESLSSVRLVIPFFISIIFLNSEFKMYKLFALFGILVGVILVTGFQRNTISENKTWILWALISGVMFAILIISSKIANIRGLPSPLIPATILIIAGILYIVQANRYLFDLKFTKILPDLILATICATFGNLVYFNAIIIAPNPAYPVAISNSRIVLLYIAAILMGKDKFHPVGAVGIFITSLGIALLS